MIVAAGAILGAAWGAYLARRREGGPADMAQYAAGFAIAFGVLGLFLTLFLSRGG